MVKGTLRKRKPARCVAKFPKWGAAVCPKPVTPEEIEWLWSLSPETWPLPKEDFNRCVEIYQRTQEDQRVGHVLLACFIYPLCRHLLTSWRFEFLEADDVIQVATIECMDKAGLWSKSKGAAFSFFTQVAKCAAIDHMRMEHDRDKPLHAMLHELCRDQELPTVEGPVPAIRPVGCRCVDTGDVFKLDGPADMFKGYGTL